MATKTTNRAETDDQRKARETVEEIAKNIAALSRSVAALLNGPLNKKALTLLVASSSGLSQRVVDQVLTALRDMEKDWLK